MDQLGGEFVFDKVPNKLARCLYAYRMRTTRSHGTLVSYPVA